MQRNPACHNSHNRTRTISAVIACIYLETLVLFLGLDMLLILKLLCYYRYFCEISILSVVTVLIYNMD